MFRADKHLRIMVVFIIAVSLLASPTAFASQAVTVENIEKVDYKTIEVETGKYIEKSALKNVEWQFLRNDNLTIDKPQGTFVEYLVTNGQIVKEGDPLVSYQIPSDSIGITEKKMQLDQNQSDFQDNLQRKEDEVNKNIERLYTMDSKTIEAQILQLNIKKMQTTYKQYTYQTTKSIRELKATIEELETNIKLQYIYAPYEGVVYPDDKMKEGTIIDPSKQLIYIYDIKSAVLGTAANEISNLWYQMDVSVTGINNMKEDTSNTHKGKVVGVDSLYNGKVSTGMIYIQLDEMEDLLSSMQRANISTISVSVENVLVIPVSVVKNDNDMKYVFIMDDGGVIRKQYITGRDNGSEMWVYSGLAEGQRIVVE